MKKSRVAISVIFFLLFFLLLIVKIISISLTPDSRLLNELSVRKIPRGNIYGAHGEELAVTSFSYALYARPGLLNSEMKSFLKNTLSKLNFFSDQDLKRFNSQKGFSWIKKGMTLRQQKYIRKLIRTLKESKNLNHDELGIIRENTRFYPYPSTSGVVGVVGVDKKGLLGLEYHYDAILRKGISIQTSIDPKITQIAYEELKDSVTRTGSLSGSVAIVSPKNGHIVALVSYPGFDPNHFASMTLNNIKPIFSSYIFEPGSVMKQFSAAYALENNIASPHYPVFFCNGAYKVRDQWIRDDHPHGRVDLSLIIQKSCNVGMAHIARSFNNKKFYYFLRSFGFGQRPALPLTSIEKGILRSPEDWSFLSKYMIAMGQEIGVTTLQLVSAASIIANMGEKFPLRLVLKTRKFHGDWQTLSNPSPVRVISRDTSTKLLTMMKTVVSENGTAIKAHVNGVSIAGKTGTGQVARPDGGGYYTHRFNAVFTGYVPADNPVLVMVVALHQPKIRSHTGGEVAAPVFANIIRRIMVTTDYFEKRGHS